MQRVYRPAPHPSITRIGRVTVTASAAVRIDALPHARAQGVQSEVRAVWCDVSRQPSGVRIFAPSTGARESWPAGSIGWGAIWAVDDCQLEITSNRTVTAEIMVSSEMLAPSIHDAGDIHPLALDQSEHVSVTASAVAQRLLGPNGNAMGEGELRSLARCGYTLRNASNTDLYVLEWDDTTPPVSATKHSYVIAPGAQVFRDVPYASEVHAVSAGAPAGTYQLTAYYREQFP